MGLTAEQLELRKHGMGASDVAMLVTGKPIDVWLRKTGRDEQAATDAMELGHDMEPGIVGAFSRRVKPARLHGRTVPHPKHDWLFATPDGETLDEAETVEAKLVGGHRAHLWTDAADGLPEYPLVQATVQMGVTGRQSGYVAALIGSTTFRHYRVTFDVELFEMLVDRAGRFWRDYVLTDTPPEIDGSDGVERYLRSKYPRNTGGITLARPELDAVARCLTANRESAKALERTIAAQEQTIRDAIGNHDAIEGSGWRATWKATASGGVDWKGLAAKIGFTPDLERQFTREGSRRFVFTATGME